MNTLQIQELKKTISRLSKLVEELEIDEPLKKGDTVRVLTTGRIGKRGSLATVIKVKQDLVEIDCNGVNTHRKPKNLRKISTSRNEEI
jgi:ribosomal protein L24